MPDLHSSPATPPDALALSRAATRRTLLAGFAASALAAAWALYLPQHHLPAPATNAHASSPEPAPPPLDLAAFQAPVWTVAEPPKVAATPPPPPPPPPLKLQLLGIVQEGETYKAVLFDPDANKVRVVAAGDVLQGRTIERIAADSVSIKSGAAVQTLALKAPGVTP